MSSIPLSTRTITDPKEPMTNMPSRNLTRIVRSTLPIENYVVSNKTDNKCKTTKPDYRILKVNNRPTASLPACGNNFAMLACAANFL
jgi:hypothetical protein